MREIKSLLEQYLEIVNSDENKANIKYWDNAREPYLVERWRGISSRRTNTPFTMALDISGYSKVLGIDCTRYYTDAEEQLYQQLRYAIWEFHHLKCHRYFENSVFISFGSIFEASLFGAGIHYLPAQAPWIDEKVHLIKQREDLLKIKPFDFYKSGLCENAIRFYETMKRLMDGYDIKVMFPITLRSPFSTALMLRGYENLLLDIYDDPQFFHNLMRMITDYLMTFAKRRAEFLGEPVAQCMLFNDEVAVPNISNAIYKSMIQSYEKELGELCGGVRYWHSCGVTNEFYDSIAALPKLRMMHIGPWSDIRKAVDVFASKDIALEICLNSVENIYEKTEEEMKRKLLDIREICDGRIRYSVRADGLALFNSMEFTMDKIRQWNNAAMEVFPG